MDTRTRYDTTDVARTDRLAYWQDAVCDTYVQLGCESPQKRSFNGVIEIARHSVLAISRVSGAAQTVRRRRRDIQQATDPFFLLSLQIDESCVVSQFDQSAHLRPGDMALYSSADTYTLNLSDQFSQMVVQLPADRLLARLPNAQMLAACKIDGQSGIGQLVRENIMAFSAHIDTSNPMVQALVQDTLIDLIATGLAAQGQGGADLSSPEQQVLLRAKSFVRDNLGDPALNRTRVAQQVGLSVRRLNAIFAKNGASLSAHIRHARLDAVASDLREARFNGLSITEIAFKHGFSNAQNFSTSFRARFDMSPRDYRARS